MSCGITLSYSFVLVCKELSYNARMSFQLQVCNVLRIEMQILSVHWMMQNIRLFNVCEIPGASRRH